MLFLESPHLRIVPFEGQFDWEKLAAWFYDPKYKNFWRHHPRAYRPEDFQNYPKIAQAEVFTIRDKKTNEIAGMVQIAADSKSNRGFYIGLIIDEKFQGNRLPLESFIVMFNYAFNRLGFKKAIVEIAEAHESLKKIMVENGFLFEGKFFGEYFQDGKFCNELRYCMMDTYYNKTFKPILEGW